MSVKGDPAVTFLNHNIIVDGIVGIDTIRIQINQVMLLLCYLRILVKEFHNPAHTKDIMWLSRNTMNQMYNQACRK